MTDKQVTFEARHLRDAADVCRRNSDQALRSADRHGDNTHGRTMAMAGTMWSIGCVLAEAMASDLEASHD